MTEPVGSAPAVGATGLRGGGSWVWQLAGRRMFR